MWAVIFELAVNFVFVIALTVYVGLTYSWAKNEEDDNLESHDFRNNKSFGDDVSASGIQESLLSNNQQQEPDTFLAGLGKNRSLLDLSAIPKGSNSFQRSKKLLGFNRT